MANKQEEPQQQIDTGGGTYVQDGLTTGRDFIGRDQVQSEQIGRNNVKGTVGNVGAGAQIAIGREIKLSMTTTPSPKRPTGQDDIAQLIGELQRQVALLPQSEQQRMITRHYIEQLEQEFLLKAEALDDDLIRVARKWLLQNVPQLTDILTQLFRHPTTHSLIADNRSP